MTTEELKLAARRRLPVTVDVRRYDRITAVRWYLDRYGGEKLQAELVFERSGGDVVEYADPAKVEVIDGKL